MSDYLRMSGLYWSLTFLDLVHSIDKLDKTEVMQFVKRNQHESGGFSPCDGHEPHLLYTLSAIQVFLLFVVSLSIFLSLKIHEMIIHSF